MPARLRHEIVQFRLTVRFISVSACKSTYVPGTVKYEYLPYRYLDSPELESDHYEYVTILGQEILTVIVVRSAQSSVSPGWRTLRRTERSDS